MGITSLTCKDCIANGVAIPDSPGQDINAHVVGQLLNTLDKGSPASQQAAVDIIEELSSNAGNISKTIIKSKLDQGETSIGMSQEISSRS